MVVGKVREGLEGSQKMRRDLSFKYQREMVMTEY